MGRNGELIQFKSLLQIGRLRLWACNEHRSGCLPLPGFLYLASRGEPASIWLSVKASPFAGHLYPDETQLCFQQVMVCRPAG